MAVDFFTVEEDCRYCEYSDGRFISYVAYNKLTYTLTYIYYPSIIHKLLIHIEEYEL